MATLKPSMCNCFRPNSHRHPTLEVGFVTPKICLHDLIFNFSIGFLSSNPCFKHPHSSIPYDNIGFIKASNKSSDSLTWSLKLIPKQFLILKCAFNPRLYRSSRGFLIEKEEVNRNLK